MMRSIVSIVVGFVTIFVLNLATNALFAAVAPGLLPREGAVTNVPVLLLVCVYVGIYGIAGCYAAARLAPSAPMRHALILGALGVALSVPVTIASWADAPAWFNLYNLLAILPYAWLGGWLRERELVPATRPAF
jgi:hypothetical protein